MGATNYNALVSTLRHRADVLMRASECVAGELLVGVQVYWNRVCRCWEQKSDFLAWGQRVASVL